MLKNRVIMYELKKIYKIFKSFIYFELVVKTFLDLES